MACVAGCAARQPGGHYQTLASDQPRDTNIAELRNADGLRQIENGQLEKAEASFREAIEHDLYYSSAHNNLGLVYLKTGRHYDAAWEFNYAARLAPRSPEPRANLGLLFEKLGRVDEAIGTYQEALNIDPADMTTMRHLARAYVKTNRKDKSLKEILEKLLLMPNDKQWDEWLRGQLIRVGRIEPGRETALADSPG
jgi:Flp pilus assembly protein TadD